MPTLLMATEDTVGRAHPTDCRLIVDPPAPGAWNMGLDEALLAIAADNGVATLRFYQWSEPTLSLGYFQRYEDRQQHAASRECAVVRRQTGGGAILHDRDLTYSLALPATHPLAKNTQLLYAAVHDAFIALLRPLTADDRSLELKQRNKECGVPAHDERFLCFERRTCGDVILIRGRGASRTVKLHLKPAADVSEFKILGSAQRRHRGAILQHGSLLLKQSPAAPELAGWRDLTGTEPPIDFVVSGLTAELHTVLQMQLVQFEISRQLESKAADLAKNKYGSAAWTKRR